MNPFPDRVIALCYLFDIFSPCLASNGYRHNREVTGYKLTNRNYVFTPPILVSTTQCGPLFKLNKSYDDSVKL